MDTHEDADITKIINPVLMQLNNFVQFFTKESLEFNALRTTHRSIKIRDSLWGDVHLSSHELSLIDTSLMQRLRYIHQMGSAFCVYPSATHNRFEHTLGVCYHVKTLLDMLGGKYRPERVKNLSKSQKEFSKLFSNENRKTLLLAALLHDIGHGALSHTSEKYYTESAFIKAVKAYPKGHKDFSRFKNAKAHEILSYFIVLTPTVSSIIESENVNPQSVADAIIGYKKGPLDSALVEFINGDFDADQFDYLFRDSQLTGIPLSVDLDNLWRNIRIARMGTANKLVIKRSGEHALEQILFSKIMLHATIYHNPAVRAAESMALGLIRLIDEKEYLLPPIENAKKHLGDKDNVINFRTPLGFLLLLDHDLLAMGYFDSAKKDLDGAIHRLAHNLLYRRLHVPAIVLSRGSTNNSPSEIVEKLKEFAKSKHGTTMDFEWTIVKEIYDRGNFSSQKMLPMSSF